jgi:phospholipase/carboxylesterase
MNSERVNGERVRSEGSAGDGSGRPRAGAISRRDFLSMAGVAVLAHPAARTLPAHEAEPRRQDPRLTVRPFPPVRAPEPGETRFGEQLDRGGILYVPSSYTHDRPAPLLVALHGSGGYAGRWASLYDACEARSIVLMAPDSRAATWDRVRGVFGPDVAFIDSALRYTFERCAVDPERIALGGFSDGASYALSLGPSNGDLFTHLIAWSPGFSDPADPIVGSPRVFVSHGSEDGVLPVAITRSGLVPMLEMDGYDVEYVEFMGDHVLTPEIAERALDWFMG